MTGKCHPKFFEISTFVHGISIAVVAVGTGIDIYQAANNEATYWLPLTLTIMLAMRIPNQICVALDYNKIDTWFTVIGSLIALGAYIALTYYSFSNRRDND